MTKSIIIKRFGQTLKHGGDYSTMSLAMRKVETLAQVEGKSVASILKEIKAEVK